MTNKYLIIVTNPELGSIQEVIPVDVDKLESTFKEVCERQIRYRKVSIWDMTLGYATQAVRINTPPRALPSLSAEELNKVTEWMTEVIKTDVKARVSKILLIKAARDRFLGLTLVDAKHCAEKVLGQS